MFSVEKSFFPLFRRHIYALILSILFCRPLNMYCYWSSVPFFTSDWLRTMPVIPIATPPMPATSASVSVLGYTPNSCSFLWTCHNIHPAHTTEVRRQTFYHAVWGLCCVFKAANLALPFVSKVGC